MAELVVTGTTNHRDLLQALENDTELTELKSSVATGDEKMDGYYVLGNHVLYKGRLVTPRHSS